VAAAAAMAVPSTFSNRASVWNDPQAEENTQVSFLILATESENCMGRMGKENKLGLRFKSVF